MKQEFITLYGKVVVERNILFIRNTDVPFSRSVFARIGYYLLLVALFIMQFFRDEKALQYTGIVVVGFLLLSRLPDLYDCFIKRSYANRISLDQIQSVEIRENEFDLNMDVLIRLKNGRYRQIIFRKLENQYEPFAELITQHINQVQFA
jgi:hypothetical protein